MSDANTRPTVVFGKLAGFGLLSIGVGTLIAASGYFISVASSANDASAPLPSAAQDPTKHDVQLVQLSDFRRDQFLVDKSTGRVWTNVCSGPTSGPDCNGMLIWQEMYVDGGITPGDSGAAFAYNLHIGSDK